MITQNLVTKGWEVQKISSGQSLETWTGRGVIPDPPCYGETQWSESCRNKALTQHLGAGADEQEDTQTEAREQRHWADVYLGQEAEEKKHKSRRREALTWYLGWGAAVGQCGWGVDCDHRLAICPTGPAWNCRWVLLQPHVVFKSITHVELLQHSHCIPRTMPMEQANAKGENNNKRTAWFQKERKKENTEKQQQKTGKTTHTQKKTGGGLR